MQEVGENYLIVQEARMREALRNGNARVYASLCDSLGIPYSARNPHLYSEGKRLDGGLETLRSTRRFSKDGLSSGLDVSDCVFNEAATDYLKGLGDKGLKREDYLARIRQIVRLGSSIPDPLRPRVGASEDELRALYSALADKARSIPKKDFL